MATPTIVEVDDLRIFTVSDLHVDNPANMVWLEEELPEAQDGDVLLLAGDVSHDMREMETVLRLMCGRGYEVCWIWGNHDVWVSPSEREAGKTSLDKIEDINALCSRLGVHTGITKFVCTEDDDRAVWVVPLHSWYEAAFDTEPDMPGDSGWESFASRWQDFQRCNWPEEFVVDGEDQGKALCELFSQRNHELLPGMQLPGRDSDDVVISMSHFIPRQELLPEKRFMMEPSLAKVTGARILEADIRELNADMHVFGHSHIPWDQTLADVRYVQWPLGYPRERHRTFVKKGRFAPLKLYDSSRPRRVSATEVTKWGRYYAQNERTPEVVEAAEWVQAYNERKSLVEEAEDCGASCGLGRCSH